MISRFSVFSRWALWFCFALAASAAVEAQEADSRSPFLPAGDAASGGAAAQNTPLEFRGMVSTKSGYMFALYDPAKHQSTWARLNEPGANFTVRSSDLANDTITVDYQGRVLTLALKEAKVETMTASPMPVMNNPGGLRPPPMINGSANAAEEARRLEAVAAEVRRRRMLRAQAAGNPQPAVPGQSPR